MTQGFSLRLHRACPAGSPPQQMASPASAALSTAAGFPSLAASAHSNPGIDLQGVTLACREQDSGLTSSADWGWRSGLSWGWAEAVHGNGCCVQPPLR